MKHERPRTNSFTIAQFYITKTVSAPDETSFKVELTFELNKVTKRTLEQTKGHDIILYPTITDARARLVLDELIAARDMPADTQCAERFEYIITPEYVDDLYIDKKHPAQPKSWCERLCAWLGQPKESGRFFVYE